MNIHIIKNATFRYFSSTDFSRGFILAIAIVSLIAVAYSIGRLPMGIGMAIGAFLVAPGDVPGNFRHRLFGMLTALGLGVGVTILGFSENT